MFTVPVTDTEVELSIMVIQCNQSIPKNYAEL